MHTNDVWQKHWGVAVQEKIGFQKFQNVWVVKALMRLGPHSLAELMALFPSNIENWHFCRLIRTWRPVHSTPKEFENEGFSLKTHQMFSVHSMPEKSENATLLSWCHGFRKTPFSKCFLSTLERKAGVFKFLRFKERFRFRDGLVWTV